MNGKHAGFVKAQDSLKPRLDIGCASNARGTVLFWSNRGQYNPFPKT